MPIAARSALLATEVGEIRYELRRSAARRTFCVQVFADGRVRASVPLQTPLPMVEAFVASRADWIARKQAHFSARRTPMALGDGAQLNVLGMPLVLRITADRAVRRTGDELRVPAADGAADRLALLTRWLRAEAALYAAQCVARFAPLVGATPKRISIRAQSTRWGSCSARGTISLNWRLMFAPAAVFDYVVVHELCHLKHPNHSPRFWAAVAAVMSDFAAHRAALKNVAPPF